MRKTAPHLPQEKPIGAVREITKHLAEPEILEVFALSVGTPTAERLAELTERYVERPSWCAYGLFESERVLGVSGVEILGSGRGRLRHLAVHPQSQRRGVGRHLIEEIVSRHALRQLSAETHEGATRFYRECCFTVVSLGERYPGVERFSCTWRAV